MQRTSAVAMRVERMQRTSEVAMRVERMQKVSEVAMRVELMTYWTAANCSTTELYDQMK